VVVAAQQQRRPGRRAKRGGVEPGVPEAARGQALGGGAADRPAEGAGGPEADVVEQDDQDVGGARGRPQRLDGGKLVAGSLAS
jgi:hypothetical protein